MAARRQRTIGTSNDLQVLKLGAPNSFVNVKRDCQILFTQARKAPVYEIDLGVQFNDATGDGIKLIAFMEKNNKDIIHAANCTFTVFNVNLSTWAETQVYSASGVPQSNGAFTLDVTEANMGGLSIDGEQTLAIQVTMYRFNKKYQIKEYINHTGIFDSLIRLKKRVLILEVKKKDL